MIKFSLHVCLSRFVLFSIEKNEFTNEFFEDDIYFQIDTDGSGTIDFEEFVKIMT